MQPSFVNVLKDAGQCALLVVSFRTSSLLNGITTKTHTVCQKETDSCGNAA